MKVAVVGATGLVGTVMLKVLEERNFPIDDFYAVASEKSIGLPITFRGLTHKIIGMQEAVDLKPDVALFSAGGDVSKDWAPKFQKNGTIVIDNSSAWRMDATKKLVVPEVNSSVLSSDDKIIANPNCSTIQMVVALAPLHQAFGIKRLVISTYQSITGTGVKAVDQYKSELEGSMSNNPAYPHKILANCLPHCDVFQENGYTREELKLVNETRKILQDPNIKITATAVRVPVQGGHSESVNVEFEKDFNVEEVKSILSESPGIVVLDNPARNEYPMPLLAEGKDDVFVGRIRRDHSIANGLNMWIVSDNLRKGAATNAVQIAEYLLQNKLIGAQPALV